MILGNARQGSLLLTDIESFLNTLIFSCNFGEFLIDIYQCFEGKMHQAS